MNVSVAISHVSSRPLESRPHSSSPSTVGSISPNLSRRVFSPASQFVRLSHAVDEISLGSVCCLNRTLFQRSGK